MATTRKNSKRAKIECVCCHEEKPYDSFYISHSPMFSITKRMPICSDCLTNECLRRDGSVDEDALKQMLQKVDRPFIQKVFDSAMKECEQYPDDEKRGWRILKAYWRSLQSLPQYVYKTYSDSDEFQTSDSRIPNPTDIKPTPVVKKNTSSPEREVVKIDTGNFKVTEEIISLFGDGYTVSEYKKMFEKYEELKKTYSIQTSLHREALITYIRFKVKEEIATAQGDSEAALKWYGAAEKAAEKAKLTPKQLTEADLHGGINSFSEIFKAVEQAVDVIPILPQFKYRPNDALDFVIWCYVNYIRNLQGMPECEYEDVYKFYDKKKEEYISQYGDPYGIFDDDPSESLRDSIKKFITLPKDYGDDDKL